jgi:hypothetical protein
MSRHGGRALFRRAILVFDYFDRRFGPPARREQTIIGPPATRPSVEPLPTCYPVLIPSDDYEAPL